MSESFSPNEIFSDSSSRLSNSPILPHRLSSAAPDELVLSYEAGFREAIAQQGSIYGSMDEMPPIVQAAHERRIELLSNLPIGDVSNKICVDYGVGSWGFACIFPQIQTCGYAIGIDISQEAIKESAAISARNQFPYGTNYAYLTSRGDDIRLKDQSIDVFFTGECIEHVENTDAFLDEIHRVLNPGGTLILTTPNADAYLYKINNERYGIGPEHVALMSYHELLNYLAPRFEVLVAHGFNGSFHYSWDEKIRDQAVARSWATLFTDRPDLGTGIVLLARRRDDYRSRRYIQHVYHHSDQEIQYSGSWQVVPLHKLMTGRLGLENEFCSLDLDFEGSGIILNFWCHPWSGKAVIDVDGMVHDVNLYSPLGGFARVCIPNLDAHSHKLRIENSADQDQRSQGREVIFYQAISYHTV
jgi:SAM-dependent methyltransferase